VASPGSSTDPTSPASLSQNSDDDTGPFTPTTIACAEEASVPKSVELAVDGDGHMDVVDVESTLRSSPHQDFVYLFSAREVFFCKT
jgi:hypothetical protein